MRIHQLPTVVANQIAAGEVIERPASVVKELLENSLDAQATVINIDIGYGGLNQIKVSDNGVGIVAEDLPLAIAAHATSKICQLQDLYSISSMGFRGEALASIASVSRLTISSKPLAQEYAMMLSVTEESTRIAPCARNQGTTIEVRDIFFNAPVRKKFLKSERSEFQAIDRVVRRFALSAPAIAINLTHNGKILLNLPAAHCDKTRLARIRKLLGKTFVEKAIYLDVAHDDLHLHGWLTTKDYQRSQTDKQWIYINSRMVKDKLLNHAMNQAYEDLLHPGRHPACLLYLTINPAEVDVNVHPTKHEVRFQQPRLVHDFVRSQIQQALQQSRLNASYLEGIGEKEDILLQVRESYLAPINKQESRTVEAKNWLLINPSFAILLLQDQPFLVDVEGLQRSWLGSILKESLPLASRPLLVPLSYPIEQEEMQHMNASRQILLQIGIEFDLGGERALIIRSLPTAVPHLDFKQFFRALFKIPSPSIAALLELLTLCQSFDAQQASWEEIEALVCYIHSLSTDKSRPWCKHLSLQICQDLLNA
jgi:DNA mismatch repair protein MutL